jgi:molecular chaperone GrpE
MRDDRQEHVIDGETAADIDEATGYEVDTEEAPVDEVTALKAELDQCRKALAEARDAHLRARADFDNFRKRMRAERDQDFGRGSDRVLADLLPVIDDFDRALAAVHEGGALESLQQGVELIYRQLLGMLERHGITPMDVQGQPFDPMYHDAVARIPATNVPEHTIVGEVQRGYLKNGDAFRPAKVAVAMPPEA